MRVSIALPTALLAMWLPASVAAQECTRCSRLGSVDACVRCSLNSQKAKQMNYPESGIRRWCQENQPACAKRK
jgi:hypothetical protein